MGSAFFGFLRLTRPANLPTAVADILAGLAISGTIAASFDTNLSENSILLRGSLLVLASISLYAGGVVLNDVFDAGLDKVERPERPIPSGLVSIRSAAVFGVVLLILGVALAFLTNPLSGIVAGLLACAILVYDSYSKRLAFSGPLNMGICRGLNLVLGMSVMGTINHPWYAVIPLVYIFAITLISRGEVHGNNKKHIIWAAFLYALVIFSVVYIVLKHSMNTIQACIFLGLFTFLIYKPLIGAYKKNTADTIKKAVMAGVLSLIVLDASLSVVFADWWYGLLILMLWPLSRSLSKMFAVT